jgi:hypothetical protein
MNLLIGLLLVGTVCGQPNLIFNTTEINIHMDEVTHIPFSIENININNAFKINLTAISSDLNIVQVDKPIFDPVLIHDDFYRSTINVTGIFLGKAEISMSIFINEVRTFCFTNFHFRKILTFLHFCKMLHNTCISIKINLYSPLKIKYLRNSYRF